MALHIENPEVERLATEVAGMSGESKTQAIGTALRERRERLRARETPADRGARLRRFLEEEVWPNIPDRGLAMTKAEREEILGYGPDGV